ncbi:MAG: hypothetical protein ACIAXF_09745 [Phycisphaerales bacterium JB063]
MAGLIEQMRLEWRYQRRRPFVWFCLAAYFLLSFSDTVRTGWGASGNFWINGGSYITIRAIIYSVLGVVAAAGLVAEPMSRDRRHRVQGLVLSTGARRSSVALGRFAVAFTIVLLSASMFIPGTILGSMMPGIPAEQTGPFVLSHYAKAVTHFILPNFLLTSALVFAVTSRFQSQAVGYGVGVGAVALWVTAKMMVGRDAMQHDVFLYYAYLDPFGTIAGVQYSMGWSVAQLNEGFPPMKGLLLYNRLLWGAVSLGIIALGVWWMPTRETLPRASAGRPRRLALTARLSRFVPALPGTLGRMVAWELKALWRHPGSKVCLVFTGFTLWWAAASSATQLFSLPTTDLLVHNTGYYFDKVLVLVLVWAAGDLLWRERTLGTSELVDAQPTGETTRFAAKTLALGAIVLAFWTLSIFVNILYQAAHGYYTFELGLYLTDSFIFKAPYYLWLAVLAIAAQSVLRQRYVAMGLVLLVYLSDTVLDALDLYHPIYRYGEVSFFWYSLMDGYGHFWRPHLWFLLYWSLGAGVLWLVGWGCYGRGINMAPRRWLWKRRLLRGGGAASLAGCVLLFLVTGVYIWVQSTVRAPWPPIDEDKIKAAIETNYGEAWRGRPQPIVVKVVGRLDLYPEERRFEMNGTFVLENQSDEPIDEVLVMANAHVSVDRIDLGPGAERLADDRARKVQHWRLAEPLLPGERLTMGFTTSNAPPPGFQVHARHDGVTEVAETEVLGNGTSMLNLRLMPVVGYTDRVEHKPEWKRRRLGLPEQWAAPSGPLAQRTAHGTLHTGWVEKLDMTITTAGDQIALHGGELVEQRELPGGRMLYRYVNDRPNRGWSEVLSARYAQRTYETPGLPDVVMYFDPRHTWTVDDFAQGFREAQSHFVQRYGPAPYDTLRMAEQSLHYDNFGGRGGLCFSTEVLGWKTDVRVSGGEDLREWSAQMVALNWFGDQLIPANIAGAKLIHSGLPYWTAELYLHQHRDADTDRRLRLQDAMEMFRNRGEMVDQELPFIEEFKDSGMVRKKGSVQILYLAHLVGIERLEAIIADFLDQHRYQGPPYPTGRDFLDHLRANVDAQYHPQLVDMFERVLVWRLSIKRVTVTPTEDGRFELVATIDARKFEVSGWGDETEVPLETPIPLAVYRGAGFGASQVITAWDERLASGESEVRVVVDELPTRFGVDPLLLLPDSNAYDNVRGVSLER